MPNIVVSQDDYRIISFQEYLNHQPLKDHLLNKYAWVKSIIVAIFPLPNQNVEKRNYLTAKFAYGKDYHKVVGEQLENLAISLQLKRYEIFTDVSFLDEKLLCYLAGLGSYGKNNLIITPKYGTNIVIGEIITDEVFPYEKRIIPDLCLDCDLCVKKCPTNALDNGFNRQSCLSYLTQYPSKDYPLYDKLRDLAVGCDICQDVCPHNKKTYPYLDDFQFDEKSIINLEILKDMDEKKYQAYYHDKTFNWIGYLKMLRNIIVLDANNNHISYEDIEKFQKLYQSEKWFYNHLAYLKGKINHGKY